MITEKAIDIGVRIAVYSVASVCLYGAGFIKGCEHDQRDQKQVEDKFILGSKQIVTVEKEKIVPQFIQTVTTIETTRTELQKEAANETPNPDVCDFSADRLRRLRIAATGLSR